MLLSNSNVKLGKEIYNFNLPRTTCEPFRTAICDRYCYAKVGAFTFQKTKDALNHNLEASLDPDFVALIETMIEIKKIKWVRLHASGDFYSQEYLDKWIEIASDYPNTRFLAFTRNYLLEYSKRPSNLIIYYSIDDSTKYMLKNHTLFATLITPIKPEQEYKHMEHHSSGFICKSACKDCKFCFAGTKNVVFLRHWNFIQTNKSKGIKSELNIWKQKKKALEKALEIKNLEENQRFINEYFCTDIK